MPKRTSEERVPDAMRPTYDIIVNLTDTFCKEHLDDEYAKLARKMAATLALKRPSPLTSGRVNSWACGILYALGRINYLFDKSQMPHLRADKLCELCGVSQQTASAKAKEIERILKIGMLDTEWSTAQMVERNPMVWLLMVNGLLVDVREMPREVQEIAFRKGFIPYIPDDGPPQGK